MQSFFETPPKITLCLTQVCNLHRFANLLTCPCPRPRKVPLNELDKNVGMAFIEVDKSSFSSPVLWWK